MDVEGEGEAAAPEQNEKSKRWKQRSNALIPDWRTLMGVVQRTSTGVRSTCLQMDILIHKGQAWSSELCHLGSPGSRAGVEHHKGGLCLQLEKLLCVGLA